MEDLFESSDEEEEFHGFPVELPEEITWDMQHLYVNIKAFSLTPGPTTNVPDSGRAMGNAEMKGASDWQPLTSKKLKAFLALLLTSNDMLVVPCDKRYYLSSVQTKLFHTPRVVGVLQSRQHLKSYIFFCDPEHENTEEEKKDVLYKVRGIYNHLVEKFKELYNCSGEIFIDEAMVPFKGKWAIQVRMPGKDERDAGKIMELVEDLHLTTHHLYVDNFYLSPHFFMLLKARGILADGTAIRRKGYPHDQLKEIALEKCGEVAWLSARNQEMTALRWKDNKDVFFLSTIHSPPVVPDWVGQYDSASDSDGEDGEDVVHRRVKVRGQWVSKKAYRPRIVMGGVDLCDQMTGLDKSKKQKCWYLWVFLKMLLLSIYNANILTPESIQGSPELQRKSVCAAGRQLPSAEKGYSISQEKER